MFKGVFGLAHVFTIGSSMFELALPFVIVIYIHLITSKDEETEDNHVLMNFYMAILAILASFSAFCYAG